MMCSQPLPTRRSKLEPRTECSYSLEMAVDVGKLLLGDTSSHRSALNGRIDHLHPVFLLFRDNFLNSNRL